MTFPLLETERLKLIEVGHQHLQSYFNIMSRDDVTKYYGMESLKNQEEAVNLIEHLRNNYESKRGIRWGIILKDTQNFVGTIGLNNLNIEGKKAEIGFELHPSYWNKGIISEAVKEVLRYSFEDLNLYRMGAVTFPDNVASNKLLKKVGFSLEGKLRRYLYQNNQSHDALIYSFLSTEY
ncbi:GNAT family N-acetyltransferase [Virgibacillus ndiopensis]|uniref:GNAT family N-acetyltransferase n=1 Tax=Virgibacillus ndiopensis TaxID=2004408 RepID=UPI000C06FC0C|nr:GNAT family protein [Virgibacillus ndiopensis]